MYARIPPRADPDGADRRYARRQVAAISYPARRSSHSELLGDAALAVAVLALSARAAGRG
jgi:hypothetical protein